MMTTTRPLILASTSPRRQFLMKEAGYTFRVEAPGHDERFPEFMPAEMVPRYLAEEKAKTFLPRLADEIVITADTVVILRGQILNNPGDRD